MAASSSSNGARFRLYLLAGLLCLWLLAICGRLVYLQILCYGDFARRAQHQQQRSFDLSPKRGVIYDRAGRELAITYKGGSNTVTVPADVPVVTFAPAERADLKPGATVFLAATKNAEGQLMASRVTVSKDGVAPPM